MLSCESALERMSEALDAPLPLEARLELEEHLAACPQCRAAYQALTQMEEVLRGIGETPAPPELSAQTAPSSPLLAANPLENYGRLCRLRDAVCRSLLGYESKYHDIRLHRSGGERPALQ